jgi:hypothetical protein
MAGSPAAAQDAAKCELHIWPTKRLGAVFHGATGTWNGYGATVKTHLSQMDEVAAKLGEGIAETDQQNEIRTVLGATGGRFGDFRLIFHAAPGEPKYDNWIAKDVGVGERDAPSASACYAELHVVFITLFRTAISKKIQTGFLYRAFEDDGVATRRVVGTGSTGAPGFTTDGDTITENGKTDLRAAFRENLSIFLRSKKMR